jgi:4-carboxymuconolactone decarboxylase
MNKELFDKGMKIRRATLGDAYVDRALGRMNDFNKPMQELVTEYCWGEVWGRPGLSRRDRSMINIAMIAILNRHNELKGHLRGALNNGLTREEVAEVLLQVGIYGGIPAAVDSFNIATDTFNELDAENEG